MTSLKLIRKRVSYGTYKKFLMAVRTRDVRQIMEAAFILVDNKRGHGSYTNAAAAHEAVTILPDDVLLEEARTDISKRAMLVGHKFAHPEQELEFIRMLKGTDTCISS
jgi:hypothetical protein